MWILKNYDGFKSIENKKTTEVEIRLDGHSVAASFSTLGSNWEPQENISYDHLLIEFECINEMKNFKKGLSEAIRAYDKLYS